MAGKIVSLMNDDEKNALILAHYEAESQTLTSDAEANLLKLKEIAGLMNAQEEVRWNEIKEIFRKNNKFAGLQAGDSTSQVLTQLSTFNEHLQVIASAMEKRDRVEARLT